MRRIESEIFLDLNTDPQDLISISEFFGENSHDMHHFSKIRHFPARERNTGGGGPKESSQKRRGKDLGWTSGPGKYNVERIPEESRREGGPWTRKNKGPAPVLEEEQ